MIVDNLKGQLRGAGGGNERTIGCFANYWLNNNVALDQALTWEDQAIGGVKKGQTLGLKSTVLFWQGSKQETVKIVNVAKEIETKSELNLLAYQLVSAWELKTSLDFF